MCAAVAGVCFALTIDGAAQGRRTGGPGTVGGVVGTPPQGARAGSPPVADDPLSGPLVTKAPFSAEAVTTVTQVLGDGTRIEQSSTAKLYRDSSGRVRREQTILGLAALNPSGETRTVITIDPDPGDAFVYTLDPANMTARRVSSTTSGPVLISGSTDGLYLSVDNITRSVNDTLTARRVTRVGAQPEARGVSQPEESLGTRQMEGLTVVGRRTKSVIPTGQIGNDRPIEIIDERWESADLRLLVRSLHRDPRTGDVEYRLTNVVRSEPPADLFVVPADYTIQSEGGRGGARTGGPAPAPRTGGPGQRTGGGGQ
jgi:hypothetical protein